MEKTYHIEVLKSGAWQSYSLAPFSTRDEAAHECLLIMPDLRRHWAGVRIICQEIGADSRSATTDIVFEKRWGAAAAKASSASPTQIRSHKPAAAKIKSDGMGPWLIKNRYIVAGVGLSIAVALAVVYGLPGGGGLETHNSTAPPPAQPQNTRQSYIYHPPPQGGDRDPDLDYRAAVAALQADNGRERFFNQRPKVTDQAEDVISVLDGLDYMNCLPREEIKSHLSDAFISYLARTGAPAADKVKAQNLVNQRLMQHDATLKDRDKVLSEIGCGGLFGMADIYVVWFQNHR